MQDFSHEKYAADIEIEHKKDCAAIGRMHHGLNLIADGFDRYWGWGDGEGGWFFTELYKRLRPLGVRWPTDININPAERPDETIDLFEKSSRKGSKANISRALSRRVMERDLYRCVDCGTHKSLTCDHDIPESKGGPTTYENLRTRCMPCNHRKGTKLPGERVI